MIKSKHILWVLLSVIGSIRAQADGIPNIERKLIIEHDTVFFFSIDAESQLASISFARRDEKASRITTRQMPVGRAAEEQYNPFCFDTEKGELVCINWILNSQNAYFEAIKQFPFKSWLGITPLLDLNQLMDMGFSLPMRAPNQPWELSTEADPVKEQFYFDLITDTILTMAISNHHRMELWQYQKDSWQSIGTVSVPFDGYFSLFYQEGQYGLADQYGNIYLLDIAQKELIPKQTNRLNTARILVIDKDNNRVFTLTPDILNHSGPAQLEQIIEEAGQEVHL